VKFSAKTNPLSTGEFRPLYAQHAKVYAIHRKILKEVKA
jgi:hypothetical protein